MSADTILYDAGKQTVQMVRQKSQPQISCHTAKPKAKRKIQSSQLIFNSLNFLQPSPYQPLAMTASAAAFAASDSNRGTKRSASELSTSHKATKTTTNKGTQDTTTSSIHDDDDECPYVALPFYGEHKRAVSSVAFAPTKPFSLSSYGSSSSYALCASASADGTVKLWDVTSRMVNDVINPKSSKSSVPSPNAAAAAAAAAMGDDNTPTSTTTSPTKHGNSSPHDTFMWSTSTLAGHSRGINHVCWSPRTPNLLATASDDKTLRLWDVTRSSSNDTSLAGTPSWNHHQTTTASSSCSPTPGTNGMVKQETGEALLEFKGHSNFCFSCQFSPQGNLLVSGSFDETVKIWDVRSGECISTLPAHSDPVTSVSLNRDGTCIVSSSHDGLIRIWDVATGECLKTIYAEGNPPVSFCKYSRNGKYILSGMLDGKLRLWNTMDKFGNGQATAATGGGSGGGGGGGGRCTKTYSGHLNSKYCIVSDFMVSNPNRQSIVTGSEDGNVYLYDLQTRNVRQVLEGGHKDACLAVAAHDSKELIVSGGMTNDRTVRFWMPKRQEMQ